MLKFPIILWLQHCGVRLILRTILVNYIYDEIEVKVGDIVWFQGFKKEVIEYMSDVAEVSRDAARKGVERALKNGCKFKGIFY